MRNLLIKLLVRLVDIADPKYTEKEKEHVDSWLEYSWGHPGFEAYTGKRNREMRTYLSGGIGMQVPPRDLYVRTIGQRDELILLIASSKLAYKQKQKKKQGK